MRRLIIFVMALATFGCLADRASAKNISVSISGTHSKGEIEKTCDKMGGEFYSKGSGYGCNTECNTSNGEKGSCGVSCDKGNCSGSVPAGVHGAGKKSDVAAVLGGATEGPPAKPAKPAKPGPGTPSATP